MLLFVISPMSIFAPLPGLIYMQRRGLFFGLLVFLLVFIIPVVLLYLAPDEWFAKDAVLPRHDASLADPSQEARVSLPPVLDHRRRDR